MGLADSQDAVRDLASLEAEVVDAAVGCVREVGISYGVFHGADRGRDDGEQIPR